MPLTHITPTPQMLSLPGPLALSPFRVATLTAAIEAVGVAVHAVRLVYVHYVDVKEGVELLSEELQLLLALLEYDTPAGEAEAELIGHLTGTAVSPHVVATILPRPGTILPWLSKATNIAEVCGLGDRIVRIERGVALLLDVDSPEKLLALLGTALVSVFDRMTQAIYTTAPSYDDLFAHHAPKPLVHIDVLELPDNLTTANKTMGLALDAGEIDYLLNAFRNQLGRNPTDVELFMFAQVNSEHCRHKIFNALWTIDGEAKPNLLFGMIRNTHKVNGKHTVLAYSDNAAVFEGAKAYVYTPLWEGKVWTATPEVVHTLAKVETHNHPTAVLPFPGAATGSGGEIRDEGAVGRGSKSKCGLSGFLVLDLHIPTAPQPWEVDAGKPAHIALALDIMVEAPIGLAAFNNEFGRPCINGFFRTLTTVVPTGSGEEVRGFHKPIMLAGGMGAVRPQLALKNTPITPGACLVVLGGQLMLIGLGGGAASSILSGEGSADLDFALVQRGNPEMQRRAQQVIDACVSLGADLPIQLIHDVGAGGLLNALPELVHDNNLGAVFELRDVLLLEPGMLPMEIWCNELQERYVLGVAPERLEQFAAMCTRERAPFAVVGRATAEQRLVLKDSLLGLTPIDLEMLVLFGKPPKMTREAVLRLLPLPPFEHQALDLGEAVLRVMHLPAVGSKLFLITIGDRTVTGLIDRDQMVGPWQVPVADVGVTATSLGDSIVSTGEALATGERPLIALILAAASAKMTVAESLLNLFAADITLLERVILSANWMLAALHPGEGAALYEAVQAIGLDLCPDLGVSIPVGKDLMLMKMKWDAGEVTAPLALTATAFGPVGNTSRTWTPMLQQHPDSVLVLVDLGAGHQLLGGSALAQVFRQVGNDAPTVRLHQTLKGFLTACIELHQGDSVLAYHDRSDGGLFTTVVEMAFAARCGVAVETGDSDLIASLFNEELGAVFQIPRAHLEAFTAVFAKHGVQGVLVVATPSFSSQAITVAHNSTQVYASTRSALQEAWSSTLYQMQRRRDNPASADLEFKAIADDKDPGLHYTLTFDVPTSIPAALTARPKVAILREQGVNGQMEMAWCFGMAGFTPVDVHMLDILSGKVLLDDFVGFAACGGFLYGDVLGAGNGWAKLVLYHKEAREQFRRFFNDRSDTFAFGACNGCQFLSRVSSLIPGAENWPTFERNASEQYEARVAMVEVVESDLVFLKGMAGSKLPIAVAHGEGQATFKSTSQLEQFEKAGGTAVQFVDNYDQATEVYPFNPNGSPHGITGVSANGGRVLAMMPHPERVVRLEANSYYPGGAQQYDEWAGFSPWIKLFRNARAWVEEQ